MRNAIGAGLRSSKPLSSDACPARCGLAGKAALVRITWAW